MADRLSREPGLVSSLLFLLTEGPAPMKGAVVSTLTKVSLMRTGENVPPLLHQRAGQECLTLLSSPHESDLLRSEVALLLGHNLVQRSHILSALVHVLSVPITASPALVDRSCVWLATILCQEVPAVVLDSALPSLLVTRMSYSDPDRTRDACSALAALVSAGTGTVQVLLDVGTGPAVLSLLSYASVCESGLRLIGSLVAAASCDQVQRLIDLDLFTCLHRLLLEWRHVRLICWILANCAAGTEAQIEEMRSTGLLALVARVLSGEDGGDFRSLREAGYCISHVTACGSLDQIKFLCEQLQVMEPLVRLLEFDDVNLLLAILSACDNMLTCGAWQARRLGQRGNRIGVRLYQVGGVERLQLLAHTASDARVRSRAQIICQRFFPESSFPVLPPIANFWFHVGPGRRPRSAKRRLRHD